LNFKGSIIIALLALAVGCDKAQETEPKAYALLETPEGFPDMEFPEDNEYTEARWNLGKKLFFDPLMSSDYSVSCASCHDPKLAFSDDVAFSSGAENAPGTRNSPSLANVGYHPYFTREGGVPTLEMQILVPIQEHNEFNTNILTIADRLNEDDEYVQMSLNAYDRVPNPYVITRAIATFERTLVSGNSSYDQNLRGESSLSASALRGLALFFSDKTNCSTCHAGFNFTNYTFENNGLYEEYEDVGRFRLTRDSADLSVFKVPSLRNVELTGPYMHDGSKPDLSSVIAHYNSGGYDHVNKNKLIKPLNLSEKEQDDLVAFLKSLTDKTFIKDEKFQEH